MNKKITDFNENSIDVISFLAQYYGIISCDLKIDKITHKNLSSLFPFLRKVSIDWALKNQELIYTGKLVFVRDCNNFCVPYVIQEEYRITSDMVSLDEREYLICQLVSAIEKLICSSQKSLIILENNDDINSYIIGSQIRNVEICDDSLVSINNPGGILISNLNSITTFDFIVKSMKDLNSACYSNNYTNALNLSKFKDIILITVTDCVYITYEGKVSKDMSLLEIRNFLIKMYYPKEPLKVNDVCNDCVDFSYLHDYELEKLIKKFHKEKNYENYFMARKELRRRHRKNKLEKRKTKKKGGCKYD